MVQIRGKDIHLVDVSKGGRASEVFLPGEANVLPLEKSLPGETGVGGNYTD